MSTSKRRWMIVAGERLPVFEIRIQTTAHPAPPKLEFVPTKKIGIKRAVAEKMLLVEIAAHENRQAAARQAWQKTRCWHVRIEIMFFALKWKAGFVQQKQPDSNALLAEIKKWRIDNLYRAIRPNGQIVQGSPQEITPQDIVAQKAMLDHEETRGRHGHVPNPQGRPKKYDRAADAAVFQQWTQNRVIDGRLSVPQFLSENPDLRDRFTEGQMRRLIDRERRRRYKSHKRSKRPKAVK